MEFRMGLGLSLLLAISVAHAEPAAIDVNMLLIKPESTAKTPEQTLSVLPRGKTLEARILKALDVKGETLSEANPALEVMSEPSLRANTGESAEIAIGA